MHAVLWQTVNQTRAISGVGNLRIAVFNGFISQLFSCFPWRL